MSYIPVVREAIRSHIKALNAERQKLQKVADLLAGLSGSDSDERMSQATSAAIALAARMQAPPKSATQATTPVKSAKRKRLQPDTAKDLAEKIVKAARAYGSRGAARSDIVTYLDRNGYQLGHHYTNPILTRMINDSIAAGHIIKQGDRSKAVYIVKVNAEGTLEIAAAA